jgi:hypothetical protein
MSLYFNWAYADNMGILRAFVSTPVGHTRAGGRPDAASEARPVFLTSACSQRALLRTGAVGQKPIKPVTEKPATSRLFNFPFNKPG